MDEIDNFEEIFFNQSKIALFEKDTDIEEELIDQIHPDIFGEYICDINDKMADDYSSAVYKECRNAVAWIINKLKNTMYIYDINVIEGFFDSKDHCWINIGDYNIDLTLAQFLDNCPKFAVTLVENQEKLGYEIEKKFSPMDWVKLQR